MLHFLMCYVYNIRGKKMTYRICKFKDGEGTLIFRIQRKKRFVGWGYVREALFNYNGNCIGTAISEWPTNELVTNAMNKLTSEKLRKQRHLIV